MSDKYGIYVHSPWCRTRCPYCAFNVFLDKTADYDQWLSSIHRAWEIESTHFSGLAHSLYFGGGTPSLTPPAVIGRLINDLPLSPEAEITLETNPGTVDPKALDAMVTVGVNRLSIGIQTFNRSHAKRLGRGHTVDQALALAQMANTLGFKTWSMDLMFALPHQTESELEKDLAMVLELSPPHISLYGLSIEPNTPFDRAAQSGSLTTPEPDLWRRMYDRIVDTLVTAGWERYEVSNFARPGHRAVHNEAVWRGGHYAGLGPGAHGFRPSGERTIGPPNLQQWLEDPNPDVTRPTRHEHAMDRILSTLRHSQGLDLNALRTESGLTIEDQTLRALTATGSLRLVDAHLQLTPEAYPIADGIVRRLIEGLTSIGESSVST